MSMILDNAVPDMDPSEPVSNGTNPVVQQSNDKLIQVASQNATTSCLQLNYDIQYDMLIELCGKGGLKFRRRHTSDDVSNDVFSKINRYLDVSVSEFTFGLYNTYFCIHGSEINLVRHFSGKILHNEKLKNKKITASAFDTLSNKLYVVDDVTKNVYYCRYPHISNFEGIGIRDLKSPTGLCIVDTDLIISRKHSEPLVYDLTKQTVTGRIIFNFQSQQEDHKNRQSANFSLNNRPTYQKIRVDAIATLTGRRGCFVAITRKSAHRFGSHFLCVFEKTKAQYPYKLLSYVKHTCKGIPLSVTTNSYNDVIVLTDSFDDPNGSHPIITTYRLDHFNKVSKEFEKL